MSIIALDIGGTKIAAALFTDKGDLLFRLEEKLRHREGEEVAELALTMSESLIDVGDKRKEKIRAIGISVPGIAYSKTGEVWAPNIRGWDLFPLKEYMLDNLSDRAIPVLVESDRTCHILGEIWKGAARRCSSVVLIAVGTGIGAGIYLDGRIIHGSNDIIGAAGWMALEPPYSQDYDTCGCFEYFASGNGIAARAREMLKLEPAAAAGWLMDPDKINAQDVFAKYTEGNHVAIQVISKAIEMWGMASANIVSLLNPEKIIWGGGVFGPAANLIGDIYKEASRWAQPISIRQVQFVPAELGPDAGLYGAARLALTGNNGNVL